METFIKKYDNFIVDDTKHKYLLQVSRAIHQSMPVLASRNQQVDVQQPPCDIEQTEDYLHFVNHVLNTPVERLLPLQEQMALLNEKSQQAENKAIPDESVTQSITFQASDEA